MIERTFSVSFNIFIFAVYVSLLSPAVAETLPSEIRTEPVNFSKPLGYTPVANEAVSGWIHTSSKRIANLGTWSYGEFSPDSDPVSTYYEAGKMYGVYSINQISGEPSGIGYVLRISGYSELGGQEHFHDVPLAGNMNQWTRFFSRVIAAGSVHVNYDVKLLTTGAPIRVGDTRVPLQRIATTNINGFGKDNVQPIYLNSFNVYLQQRGCTADVFPNVYGMGVVSEDQFAGTGTVNGLGVIKVSLNCDNNLNVYASMSDYHDPGNTTDMLTLSPEGAKTASGVRVRLLKENNGGTPVVFGPRIAILDTGAAHQWQVKSVSDGNHKEFSLRPQYIKTGPISPGVANARASITFAYD